MVNEEKGSGLNQPGLTDVEGGIQGGTKRRYPQCC